MRPLQVKFQLRRPALRIPTTMVMTEVSLAMVRELRDKADSGAIDTVMIVGYNAAVGWRANVRRAVQFIEQPTTSAQHAVAQMQAAGRVVQAQGATS